MSQILSVQTFADSGPNATVNGSRMNSHVNDATLLNGAVLDQAEKTLPVSADTILLGDSTVAASGYPKKVQVGNLLLESQRNGTQQYVASDTGAANAYVVALAPAATAYTAGMVVRFRAGAANTTASTVNVNGLGVKTIKNRAGADLAANDILASAIVEVVYDGTNFYFGATVSADQITATKAAENFRSGESQYAADGGGANAYTAALSPAATAYAAGLVVRFKAGTANTGASTLNVNALGVKTLKKIVKIDGTVGDLLANDILPGDLVTAVYDGTYFQICGHIRSWDYVSALQTVPAAGAALTVAHALGVIPTKLRVVLVQNNASAQQGYAQNDEVELAYTQDAGVNSQVAFAVAADATNVTVARQATNIQLVQKTGSGPTSITATNWQIKVYASL